MWYEIAVSYGKSALFPAGGDMPMIQEMVQKMAWLGHDSFRIDTNKTLYFDPYQIPSGPKADLILISHEHFDHCSPEDVAKIQKPKTVIVTEKDSAKKLKGDVRVMKPGDTLSVEGIKIEAVPSYNVDKDFHPRKNAWLGFVVEVDGVRIYHAGDCDFIPEMKNLHVDIALLPVSGTYVMTAEQAVQAALAINPKLVIPMHYGAIVGDEQDAAHFKKSLAGKLEVLVLKREGA
jgi:L-ascorbate metabolism protein UlaG (beta-lactamase superfamily)